MQIRSLAIAASALLLSLAVPAHAHLIVLPVQPGIIAGSEALVTPSVVNFAVLMSKSEAEQYAVWLSAQIKEKYVAEKIGSTYRLVRL